MSEEKAKLIEAVNNMIALREAVKEATEKERKKRETKEKAETG